MHNSCSSGRPHQGEDLFCSHQLRAAEMYYDRLTRAAQQNRYGTVHAAHVYRAVVDHSSMDRACVPRRNGLCCERPMTGRKPHFAHTESVSRCARGTQDGAHVARNERRCRRVVPPNTGPL
eukprot:1183795-Prorocentrum_minimum.AAC.2